MIRPRKNKFGARRTVVDGVAFDSAAEARRWGQLRLLERAGQIAGLKRQVPFQLHAPNGEAVATYYADFTYMRDGRLVVEDVKSKPTAAREAYRIKRRWMLAEHGIEIQEIGRSLRGKVR